MNIILCVVAASILINVVKSGRSAEEKLEELKKIMEGVKTLEDVKTRLEVIEKKLIGQPQLENDLMTMATDIGKVIETLKIFERQRKAEAALSEPKRELTNILEKLPAVKTKLGNLKNEANSKTDIFNGAIDKAIQYADELSKVLKVALKVEDKDINFKDLRKKASTLWFEINQISHSADVPEKAKQLQQSVLITALGIRKILQNLVV